MKRADIDNSFSILTFAPEADDLPRLADAGFKTIVNLRQAGEQGEKLNPQAESEEARESGLESLHYPISPSDLTASSVKALAAELERLPSPVAIHCASGRSRMIATPPRQRSEGGKPGWKSAKLTCHHC